VEAMVIENKYAFVKVGWYKNPDLARFIMEFVEIITSLWVYCLLGMFCWFFFISYFFLNRFIVSSAVLSTYLVMPATSFPRYNTAVFPVVA